MENLMQLEKNEQGFIPRVLSHNVRACPIPPKPHTRTLVYNVRPSDEVSILNNCPKCGAVWKNADKCRDCGASLYDCVEIKRPYYWCLTDLKRIYNFELRLQKGPEGKVLLICPYCHTNLQAQSITNAIVHWIKYPLMVSTVVFLLWMMGRLLGRDVLL